MIQMDNGYNVISFGRVNFKYIVYKKKYHNSCEDAQDCPQSFDFLFIMRKCFYIKTINIFVMNMWLLADLIQFFPSALL